MKKVSVIVPVYNAQKYLKKCAESLVHQTLEEIEIIFVNDGSTDDSLKILEDYRRMYPQKVVIYSKENGGQASARNLGIQKSQGEYLGFVDADDYVDTDMFEQMYEKARQEDSDYVECQYRYLKIDESGNETVMPQYGNVRAYHNRKEMFIDPLVSPWNKIYRASIIKENHCLFTEGVIYEDTAFYIKVIPYLEKLSYLPTPYVHHYLWSGSTMNDKKYMRVGNIFVVLQDAIDFYKKNSFYDEYRSELEYFCVKILLCSSLKRIAKIENKKLRKDFMIETEKFVKESFPDYRKNPYMKAGLTGFYMKCMNRFTIPMALSLFRIKKG